MSLYSNTFYHGTLRKYVIAFGNLFNDLEVVRYKLDGSEDHRVRVPLSYAPKEKFIVRLTQDPDIEKKEAIRLPRMGFELIGLQYQPDRKLPNNVKMQFVGNPADPNSHKTLFLPVPYDIQMNLYAFAKSADEASQIAEQILPLFTPDYSVSINAIPELNHKLDVPITLVGVNPEDNYDGSFLHRRSIIWTFMFVMKGYFYGPVKDSAIIRKSITQVIDNTVTDQKVATVTVEPTHATIPQNEITAADDYGFSTEITEP